MRDISPILQKSRNLLQSPAQDPLEPPRHGHPQQGSCLPCQTFLTAEILKLSANDYHIRDDIIDVSAVVLNKGETSGKGYK